MSFPTSEREVSALVPRRMPPGAWALASPETAFSVIGVSMKQWGGLARRTVDGDTREIANLLAPGAGKLE